MKRFIKVFLFFLIFGISKNVFAYNQYEFNESNVIDSNSGLYSACTSIDDTAYCLFFDDIGTYGGDVSTIDLNTNQRTFIKRLSERYFYTAITAVDDGFLMAGLDANTYKMVVSYYNSSFTLVRSQSFSGTTVATSYIIKKIGNDYFVLNEGAVSDNTMAIRVSSDFQTMELVGNLDSEEYEYVYVYNYIDKQLPSSQSLLLLQELDGGYIAATSPLSVHKVYIYYYKDGEIQWSQDFDDTYIGNVFTRDNRFYMTFEETSNYRTTFKEYNTLGEELNSTSIPMLDDNHRFFLGNFLIGEYQDKILLLSYSPGNDPDDYYEWSNYKIASLMLSNEIIVESNGGEIEIDKDTAFSGEEINFTVNPPSGYILSSVSVTDYSGNRIEVQNKNHFIMPNSAVVLRVEYSVNNPKTGNFNIFLTIIILLLCSFPVYYYCTHKN